MQNQNNRKENSEIEAMKEKLSVAKDFVEKLEREIAEAEAKREIGYENDPIFLLSIEEYEKLKDAIPTLPIWWWLRSPILNDDKYARIVNERGASYDCGFVCIEGAVRPVIDLNKVGSLNFFYFIDFDGVHKISSLGTTWVKLVDDYYIAENPIAFKKFDSTTNDYESSEIRLFLLNWFQARNQ